MNTIQESENLMEAPDGPGPLERLFPCSESKILDHVIAMKDFDYSISEISRISGVGFKTTLGIVHKLEEENILRRTRNVGRAIMYRFELDSPRSKAVENLAFRLADEFASKLAKQSTLLAELNPYEEVIRDFEETARRNPNDARAYHNKGTLLATLNRHSKAIECFDLAIRLVRDDTEAYIGKGISLAELNRYEEAIRSFEEATRWNPNDARAYHNKGALLARLNRHKEAIECFERAAKL